jgi:predicted Zn-dependent peptidase
MQTITTALDELYGARIEPMVRKKGELQCVGFYCDYPDARFIPNDENVFEKTISLLAEMLLSPILCDNLFVDEYVESEKKNLIDDINIILNDKRAYSIHRLIEEMCASEPYSIDKLGTESQTRKITAESLTAHYKSLLENSVIEIIYCGAKSHELVKEILSKSLINLPPRGKSAIPQTTVLFSPVNNPPKRVTESLNVSQGRLTIGYRVGKAMQNPDYPALVVFNSIFGGGLMSKLFVNIREKLSLCYDIGSMIDKHKGIMVVSTGVEFKDFEAAEHEINTQLQNVKIGDITDAELHFAKAALKTSIKSALDRPSGLEGLYFDSSVSEYGCDPVLLCDRIDEVQLHDITQVAKNIEPDTIHTLKN